MTASRVLHIPLSGRDRRHYGNELRKAQREHERLTREAEAAHAAADRALAEAHRLDCELWSARLFLGGPDQPSPSIADVLHGGYELLEVQCRQTVAWASFAADLRRERPLCISCFPASRSPP